MKTIVDYVSFSVPVNRCDDGDAGGWWFDVIQELFLMDELNCLFNDRFGWKGGAAMRPYNLAWHRSDSGVMVHGNPNMPHMTVQVSGAGCAALRETGEFEYFLNMVVERLTRIDIATDIVTDVTPAEFANAREKGRFKSGGEKHSPTGSTEYVGSRDSEQFLRVYMYNPPHPRAGVLRAEFELHRLHARSAARGVLSDGAGAVARVLGKTFGLKHPLWQPEKGDDIDIKPDTPERKGTPKLMWLNKQVAPTIIRLHNEGAFDARKWIDDILNS